MINLKKIDKINNFQKILILLLILNLFFWNFYDDIPSLNDREELITYMGVNITLFIGIILFKSN